VAGKAMAKAFHTVKDQSTCVKRDAVLYAKFGNFMRLTFDQASRAEAGRQRNLDPISFLL
jgi:hypothetical protein